MTGMGNSKTKTVDAHGGEIILYRAKDGTTTLDVRVEKETIWLDVHQMAKLFERDRSVILRHVRNIFRSKELTPKSTCAKIAQVAADGKTRQMDVFNLDVIIGVGYRVNSLVALTLLIAESKPAERDTICKVVVNLINRENL